MNNFVDSEYDSFEKKREVKLKDSISPTIIDNTLEIHDITVSLTAYQQGSEDPYVILVVLFLGQVEIQELIIKLNDQELIKYKTDPPISACDMTIADLEKICEAKTVEIRLRNYEGHTDFTSEDIQFGAKAIYNAIVDGEAYLDDIQKMEEKQQELEREKLAAVEKLRQRKDRILNRGVNKFFLTDYDKFNQKLTVEIREPLEVKSIDGNLAIIQTNIAFRYVYVDEKFSALVIDIKIVSKAGLSTEKGELLLLLDETTRLNLRANKSYSEPYLQEYYVESNFYRITEDELKSLCDARVIEMRITNGDDYHDLTTEGLQVAARRFYNAVVDNTAYTDDLYTQEEREAAERERQHQEYLAEQERIRKEREAREAEEARIRAEKRAAWWAANKKKVGIAILILIGIIAAIIGVKKIVNIIAAKHAVTQAYEMIAQGEALIPAYKFDEAKQLYDSAFRITDDDEVHKKVQEKQKELEEARHTAESEYNNALRRLQILLDADDNEFNQYSNECLDKMIAIHPEAKTTQYFQNMRGK